MCGLKRGVCLEVMLWQAKTGSVTARLVQCLVLVRLGVHHRFVVHLLLREQPWVWSAAYTCAALVHRVHLVLQEQPYLHLHDTMAWHLHNSEVQVAVIDMSAQPCEPEPVMLCLY